MKKLVTTLNTLSCKLSQDLHALNNSNKPLQGYCKYNQVAQHLLSAYCSVISHSNYANSDIDLDAFRQNMTSVWQQLSQYNSEKYNSSIRKHARLLTQLQQLHGPASSIRRYFIRASLSDCTRTIHKCTCRSYNLNNDHWKVFFESTVCDNDNRFLPEQIKMIQRHGPSTGNMEFWNNKQSTANEPSASGTTPSPKTLNLKAALQIRMNYHNKMNQLQANSSNGKEKQKLKSQLKLSNMLSRALLDDLISCDDISDQDKQNYQQLYSTLSTENLNLGLHHINKMIENEVPNIVSEFLRPQCKTLLLGRQPATLEKKRMASTFKAAVNPDKLFDHSFDKPSFSKASVHFPIRCMS